jgi:hypothetical protein
MTKRIDSAGPDAAKERQELEQHLHDLREFRDWAVQALSKMPAARAGSAINLTPIAERLRQSADAASEAVEFLTEQLKALPQPRQLEPHERPHSLRYVNMSLLEAIQMYLGTLGRAAAEEEIIAELSAGGAIIGRKRHVGEIKKSLDTNVRSGTLKERNGKFGLGDWPAEKFK